MFTIALMFMGACDSDAGLTIFYIRHGEAGHNVVKDWADVPKKQWPAYVGNANEFTPQGELELAAVAGKLRQHGPFDFIAASPIWRARNTIVPYLKEDGGKDLLRMLTRDRLTGFPAGISNTGI